MTSRRQETDREGRGEGVKDLGRRGAKALEAQEQGDDLGTPPGQSGAYQCPQDPARCGFEHGGLEHFRRKDCKCRKPEEFGKCRR